MSGKVKVAISLGNFDCVHIGHARVISACAKYSEKKSLVPIVQLFKSDVKRAVFGKSVKAVYSLSERKEKIKKIGIKRFIVLPADANFLSLEKKEFLDYLNSLFDIEAYFCGADYRFGKNAEGDVEFLREYAKESGKKVFALKKTVKKNREISSSSVKELLSLGEVKKANAILSEPYTISGRVIKDRGEGGRIGFPTANIDINKNKVQLKTGVYYGKFISDKEYVTILNIGSRPTFGLSTPRVEAHISGFNGDLYGKKITVYVMGRLRNIKEFASKEQLVIQLKKDLKRAEEKLK